MNRFWVMILILTILFTPSVLGLASSYGESKVILKPEVPEGETVQIERSIRVKNVNDIPIKVTFEPTENFKKIATMIDEEVVLQPGELKRGNFIITLRSGGTYEGRIMMTFSPLDPDSKESSIGASSQITIYAQGPQNEYYDEFLEEEPGLDETQNLDEEVTSYEYDGENSTVRDYQENDDTEDALISDNPIKADQKNMSIFVGILIIVFIIGAGLGIFYLFSLIKK